MDDLHRGAGEGVHHALGQRARRGRFAHHVMLRCVDRPQDAH